MKISHFYKSSKITKSFVYLFLKFSLLTRIFLEIATTFLWTQKIRFFFVLLFRKWYWTDCNILDFCSLYEYFMSIESGNCFCSFHGDLFSINTLIHLWSCIVLMFLYSYNEKCNEIRPSRFRIVYQVETGKTTKKLKSGKLELKLKFGNLKNLI